MPDNGPSDDRRFDGGDESRVQALMAENERLTDERDEWKFRAERAEAEAELFNQRIALHHREEKQAKARLTEFEVGDA